MLENTRDGFRFFAERLKQRGTRQIGDLAPGEGAIVSRFDVDESVLNGPAVKPLERRDPG